MMFQGGMSPNKPVHMQNVQTCRLWKLPPPDLPKKPQRLETKPILFDPSIGVSCGVRGTFYFHRIMMMMVIIFLCKPLSHHDASSRSSLPQPSAGRASEPLALTARRRDIVLTSQPNPLATAGRGHWPQFTLAPPPALWCMLHACHLETTFR